jgi:hypothetical protein
MNLIAYIKLLDRYTSNEPDLDDEMASLWLKMTMEERDAANLVANMISKAGKG